MNEWRHTQKFFIEPYFCKTFLKLQDLHLAFSQDALINWYVNVNESSVSKQALQLWFELFRISDMQDINHDIENFILARI